MEKKPTVLICDDDSLLIMAIQRCLEGQFTIFTASHPGDATRVLKDNCVDLLLLDVNMRTPGEGLSFIPVAKEIDPDLSILMVSGDTGFETVRQAMRLGASDFIPKNFTQDELVHCLERSLQCRKLKRLHQQQSYEVLHQQRKHVMIGESSKIRQLRQLIDRVRVSPAHVVITGETGTGKEVIARLLRPTLKEGNLVPFVAVDSATIQASTAESILFGHERGAFTGAEKQTKGVFEQAHQGIVYFDEIANMPLEIQSKLLRVIQEKEVTRLGSSKVIQLDFKIICATNQNLEQMVKEGRFKADLFQRLNVIPLSLPPLRERRDDIPLLIDYFVKQQTASANPLSFSADAIEVLKQYSWPGNIRELGNLVAYLATVCIRPEVEVTDLPQRILETLTPENPKEAILSDLSSETGNFYERVAGFEKQLLLNELTKHQNNISRMATALGMNRSYLHCKLRDIGFKNIPKK